MKTDKLKSIFLRQMKTMVRALGPGLQIPGNACMDLLKLNLNLLKTLHESLVTFRIQPGSLAGHLGLPGACVYLSHFTVSSLKYRAVASKLICMFQSPEDYLIFRPRLFLRPIQSSSWGFNSAPQEVRCVQAPVTLDMFASLYVLVSLLMDCNLTVCRQQLCIRLQVIIQVWLQASPCIQERSALSSF